MNVVLETQFKAPELAWWIMAPLLVVLAGLILAVIFESVMPRKLRAGTQIFISLVTILTALGWTGFNWYKGKIGVTGPSALSIDRPTLATWALLLFFALLAFLMFAERSIYRGGNAFAASAATVPGSAAEKEAEVNKIQHTEVFALGLLSLSGMMAFVAANDLITMFVALEVMSLPLYLLSGLARRRRLLSLESAVKYFLLGSMSSALFLFGIALIYGYCGGFTMDDVAAAIQSPIHDYRLLLLGMCLMLVGLLFKVGAVPFHSWTPDVYMGAPTPVTAFMAACTKIAAMMAMVRVLFAAFGGARWDWQLLLSVIAVLTMLVGSVVGVLQSDVKRMLAYSSIAHAGFLLTAIVGTVYEGEKLALGTIAAVLFYLAAYGLATMGAFAIVTMVRRDGGEANDFAAWKGLGKRRPFLATIFAIFLLSFAGIPLTAGFVGKLTVFMMAWRGGYAWLVIVAIVMSLVAAFFYLNLIRVMFFEDPEDDVEVAKAGIATWIPVLVGICATVFLGLYPGPVLDLLQQAGEFLR